MSWRGGWSVTDLQGAEVLVRRPGRGVRQAILDPDAAVGSQQMTGDHTDVGPLLAQPAGRRRLEAAVGRVPVDGAQTDRPEAGNRRAAVRQLLIGHRLVRGYHEVSRMRGRRRRHY